MTSASPSYFDYIKLFVENVKLWELIVLAVMIWLSTKPKILERITRVKIGDLELELEQLKKDVTDQKNEIRTLEKELENEREIFKEILEGFDPHVPVNELTRTRERLRAYAKTLTDLDEITEHLDPSKGPEELYAAAVMFRERRPTKFVPQLLDCLDSLANSENLLGIRLHTVWTLASALHFTVIASVRDGVEPKIPKKELERAQQVLGRLERNPRVQKDRPDDPKRGVRGPIRYTLDWIKRGL